MKLVSAPQNETHFRIFGLHAIQVSADRIIVPKGQSIREMTRPKRSGWIQVERFCDDLIIDGVPLSSFLTRVSHARRGELLDGFGPHRGILDIPLPLHPNLGHVFHLRPDFVPRKFLYNENDEPRRFYFTEVKFRREAGEVLWYCLQVSGFSLNEELKSVPMEHGFEDWIPAVEN